MGLSTPPQGVISVVVPVRDGGRFVAAAAVGLSRLGPVVGQIVVVDDASRDDSARRLVQDLQQHLDREGARASVVLVRHEQPQGPSAARFRGLAIATGDYVWFADIDDEWEPSIVRRLLERAQAHRADVAVCRASRVELTGRQRVLEGTTRERVLEAADLPDLVLTGTLRGYLWNKLFRREVLRPAQRPPLSSQDDFLVLLETLERVERVVLIPDLLYRYHEHPSSVSAVDRGQLANAEHCAAVALTWARRRRGHSQHPEQREHGAGDALERYFRCWFWIVPVLTTPVHQGWPEQQEAGPRARARAALTWSVVVAALPHSRRRFLHAAALKMTGRGFPVLYRLAGRVLGFGPGQLQSAAARTARSSGR